MTKVAEITSKNPSLSEDQILGIFYLFKNDPNLTNSQLIFETGLSKEVLKQFKQSIREFLAEPQEEKVALNKMGIELLNTLNTQPFSWSLLSYRNEGLEQKVSQYRNTFGRESIRNLDQFYATPATSVAKALVLAQKGLLKNSKIALLGDDDLVSLVLANMGDYKSITVFDVDNDLLNFISSTAKQENFRNFETVKYDAREELTKGFLNSFDIVLTDPPYTKNGFALFLKRALELLALKKDPSKPEYIFTHYGSSFKTPEKVGKIQRIINSYGLVCEDVVNKFAKYESAESIGSVSSLYILRTTTYTDPLSYNFFAPTIYTNQLEKEENFPFVSHYVAKANKVPEYILNSKKALSRAVGEICSFHKLNVVQSEIYRFKPHGFTITLILSNSNLLLHTWPENSAVHIDLITCAPLYRESELLSTINRVFETNYAEVRQVE